MEVLKMVLTTDIGRSFSSRKLSSQEEYSRFERGKIQYYSSNVGNYQSLHKPQLQAVWELRGGLEEHSPTI